MSLGNAILTGDAKLPLPPGAKLLGTDQGRAWARMDWKSIAASAGPGASSAHGLRGWFLAYPDESDYLAETVGFTPAQVREVMEKRIKGYAQYLSDFGDELGMAAGKLAAWGRDLGQAWDRNSEKTFSLHQALYFTGRFSYGTHEDIVLLIQWRAALAAWERELAAHRACPPAWASVVKSLDARSVLNDLADTAAHLGQPAFTLAPPVDQSLRVAFTSGSPETEDRFARNELLAEPWPPKFLMALTAREIAALQSLGAATVYLDSDEYLRSARSLTPAQRGLEINRRIASGLSHQDYLASILRLRLIFLAELRGHIDHASAVNPFDAGNLARLEAVFHAEISVLDALLRLVWGAPDGPGHALRAQNLLLQALVLSFFAAQAHEDDLADALSAFEKILPNLEPV